MMSLEYFISCAEYCLGFFKGIPKVNSSSSLCFDPLQVGQGSTKGTSINHVASQGGRGVAKMTILLHKPYVVNGTKKGGFQKTQKIEHVVYG